jgi:hypothetical protein
VPLIVDNCPIVPFTVDNCPAVKLVTVALPAVRLVIEPLAAVRLVVLRFVSVKLVNVKLVTFRVPTVKLVIDPLAAVKPPVTFRFGIVGEPTQLTFPVGVPVPHCTAVALCAYALVIGKVITNPELTKSVAKTLLILVWVSRCVVVILDIFLPLKMYANVISELLDYSKTHEKVECNTYCCKNV